MVTRFGGRPTDFRRAPLVSRQPVYKPGSGWHANNVRIRDGHSSGTPVTRRLQQPTRTARSGQIPKLSALSRRNPAPPLFGLAPGGVCRAAGVAAGAVRSYRTFSPLPPLRLPPRERGRTDTGRRLVLCGTFPKLALAGRYPAPFVHGARTFLPDSPHCSLPRWAERTVGAAGAAVRPTDGMRDGGVRLRRQGDKR